MQLATVLHQVDSAVISCFCRALNACRMTTLPVACPSTGCYLARLSTSSEKRSRPLEACLLKPSNIRRPPIKLTVNCM